MNLSTPNAQASTEDFEFAALQEARNYRSALITSFGPYLRGDVVEIGAGVGQIASEIRKLPSVQHLLAVEPDSRFTTRLRETLSGASILAGTAHDIDPATNCDALVSVNVLEHIENDGDELKLYARLLRARMGHLCLFVPARPEIFAPLDAHFGHFRRYTKKALRSQLIAAGFDIVSIRYFNFVGYFAWWLSFCVLKNRGFSVRAVRFYDRAIFPIGFWLERNLSAPPIGQSLMVVARARK